MSDRDILSRFMAKPKEATEAAQTPSGGAHQQDSHSWKRSKSFLSLSMMMHEGPAAAAAKAPDRGGGVATDAKTFDAHHHPPIGNGGERHPNRAPETGVRINMSDGFPEVTKLVLSLRTLGTLGEGRVVSGGCSTLLPFVRDVVSMYLRHPAVAVRKEAALTCCLLMLPAGTSGDARSGRGRHGTPLRFGHGSASGRVVGEVLSLLLRAAVADASPEVRHCVVRALDSRYDPYLCQAHHLSTLFLLLQDGAFPIRVLALELLARLAMLNPAYVMPPARQLLVQIVVDLQCSGDNGSRESATRMLSIFLQSGALKCLVRPCGRSIINALPLHGVAPRLGTIALEALGQLSMLGMSMKPWVGVLIPHIVETMQDHSSFSKQQTSLRVLGQLVSSTGYVIAPYFDYPNLMSMAASVLPRTKNAPWALRCEVMRTLGILGAIDPQRHAAITQNLQKNSDSELFLDDTGKSLLSEASVPSYSISRRNNVVRGIGSAPTDGFGGSPLGGGHAHSLPTDRVPRPDAARGGAVNGFDFDDSAEPAHLYMYEQYAMVAQPYKQSSLSRLTPSDEDFFPRVTMGAIMAILRDPSLANHHNRCITSLMFIVKSLGLRCVRFLRDVVPHILLTVRTCDQHALRESLLQQVANLAGIVREHLRPYVPAIFSIVSDFWSSHLWSVLLLVDKMAGSVPDDFSAYIPSLTRLFLGGLEVQPEWDDAFDDRVQLILKSVRNLKGALGSYLHLLVPAILALAEGSIAKSSGGSGDGGRRTAVNVDIIRTLCVLLRSTDGKGGNSSTPTSLPARASQRLVKFLSDADRRTGTVIVETLCVCARLIDDRWSLFYHNMTVDAIVRWRDRCGFVGGGDGGLAQVTPVDALAIYENAFQNLQHRTSAHVGIRPVQEQIVGPTDEIGGSVQSGGIADNRMYDHGDGAGDAHAGFDDRLFPENRIRFMSSAPFGHQQKLHVNQQHLQRAWDVSQRSTRDDWEEWMRRFSVQLLKEAPSPALRACADLAQGYPPLARELFYAAFASCWFELLDQYKSNLVKSLKVAFVAPNVPPEILQSLLNLAEFMEHDVEKLPIDIRILADLAIKCRAYAKALHYKEQEYDTSPGACIEDLISINKKLDLPEAALGVLEATQHRLGEKKDRSSFHSDDSHSAYSLNDAEERPGAGAGGGGDKGWAGVEVKESWLAKLGSWGDALKLYERRLEENPYDVSAILGCMHCMEARGECKGVLALANQSWGALSMSESELEHGGAASGGYFEEFAQSHCIRSRSHRKSIKFCAQAAWRLGKWEQLEKYTTLLVRGEEGESHSIENGGEGGHGIGAENTPKIDFDGSFYTAILHIHRSEWELAADAINATRMAMDGRLTALMAESYKRVYPSMVTAQTLSEMEEIIQFKKLEEKVKSISNRHVANTIDIEDERKRLLSTWKKRLSGCRVDAEVHNSIMAVRSLVLGPTDEIEATLSLSVLSRQSKFFKLAEKALLDPLEALGVDLNGPVFGFRMPAELGLGSQQNDSLTQAVNIDRLVCREASFIAQQEGAGTNASFLPSYCKPHQDFFNMLVNKAGDFKRLHIQHRLYYAYVKHLWATRKNEEAMDRLSKLSVVVELAAHFEKSICDDLQVQCWVKLGNWKMLQAPPGTPISPGEQLEILSAYKKATFAKDNDYKAWHSWALINFRLVEQSHKITQNDYKMNVFGTKKETPPSASRVHHIVAAVHGFVKAISFGVKRWTASVQQDMLNFLTCLFKYGELPEVSRAINDGLDLVLNEAWLGVLPQLLARIHVKSPRIRAILHSLLIKLGVKHPQALMYPLSVLLKSPVDDRRIAAQSLMDALKANSSELVEEAQLVSSELIRVAILWLELWHEGLEESSRLYYHEGNVQGMLDVLLPLHYEIEKGAATNREHDFIESFGSDLGNAHAHIKNYVRLITSNGNSIPTQGGFQQPGSNSRHHGQQINAEAEASINQAWDLYYTVFRRINKQLPGLTTLELSSCSPALQQASNLVLGIPGTYRVDGRYVKIARFNPSVQVITSKQRPRKIVIQGNDGNNYVFLLKGHEDLRQDERVMQLFGLVNALLAKDRRTNNHDLKIQRYAIAPLSHNAGVVGWVPHCDTLHILIKEYREAKKIMLNMENRLMTKMAPDYDLLTVLQKVEVFEAALAKTSGKDLYEVLWLKSKNSEEWLERRTRYTRSLAVMSMVGYILGLGDRHPSNLMLDRMSGGLLHIDFGDCFEVAMRREKFPEKVPFRLTRMLIKAMEVSGIEGSYRSTCEQTMGVLRDNRDSLVAMLEAFVYDPLISFRLLGQAVAGPEKAVLPSSTHVEKEKQSDVEVQDMNQRQPIVDAGTSNPRVRVFGTSVVESSAIMKETIQEGKDEDDESQEGKDEDHEEETGVIQVNSSDRQDSSDSHEPSQSSRHPKGLQMASEIQSMAANISSLGGGKQDSVVGSVARSRIEKSLREKELTSLIDGGEDANVEALNVRALKVIGRVQDKLTGTDFSGGGDAGPLDVPEQVQRLITQATSNENLCQLFIGWCAFW